MAGRPTDTGPVGMHMSTTTMKWIRKSLTILLTAMRSGPDYLRFLRFRYQWIATCSGRSMMVTQRKWLPLRSCIQTTPKQVTQAWEDWSRTATIGSRGHFV